MKRILYLLFLVILGQMVACCSMNNVSLSIRENFANLQPTMPPTTTSIELPYGKDRIEIGGALSKGFTLLAYKWGNSDENNKFRTFFDVGVTLVSINLSFPFAPGAKPSEPSDCWIPYILWEFEGPIIDNLSYQVFIGSLVFPTILDGVSLKYYF